MRQGGDGGQFFGLAEAHWKSDCRHCGGELWTHRRSDHGHAYCGQACRDGGRTGTARKARGRHRASEGRADHRDHQRAYRARERERHVGDHGFKKLTTPASVVATDTAQA